MIFVNSLLKWKRLPCLSQLGDHYSSFSCPLSSSAEVSARMATREKPQNLDPEPIDLTSAAIAGA